MLAAGDLIIPVITSFIYSIQSFPSQNVNPVSTTALQGMLNAMWHTSSIKAFLNV